MCAICNETAQYAYRPGGDVVICYCTKHLPAFLRPQKRAGLLEKCSPPQKKTKSSKVKEETTDSEE